MHSNESDSTLVKAARAGNKDSFAALLRRHRPMLITLCHRALGDWHMAEDAAQETALVALLNGVETTRDPLHGNL